MIPSQESLALRLFDIGAVDVTHYHKLKLHEMDPNAPLSPIFFNLRTKDNPKPGPLMPEDVALIANELINLSPSFSPYACVSGVPNAGDPFAIAYCRHMERDGKNLRLVRMTKTEPTPGKRRVTGVLGAAGARGSTVLLVDDLITMADSKLEAIEALAREELRVFDVVVLIDREQGGRGELDFAGYTLHSVFTISELLDLYVHHGKIPTSKADEIHEYIGHRV